MIVYKATSPMVAKMYVKEAFSGLNPKNKPAVTLFENKYKFNQMLWEKIFQSILTASIILFL